MRKMINHQVVGVPKWAFGDISWYVLDVLWILKQMFDGYFEIWWTCLIITFMDITYSYLMAILLLFFVFQMEFYISMLSWVKLKIGTGWTFGWFWSFDLVFDPLLIVVTTFQYLLYLLYLWAIIIRIYLIILSTWSHSTYQPSSHEPYYPLVN